MACVTKEKTGWCSHFQCPYPAENPEGVECIDVDYFEGFSFCEIGQGCLEKCPYSWQEGTEKAQAAERWVKNLAAEEAQAMEEFDRENNTGL